MGITPEIVDRDFPLQEPGGMAETIKQSLASGDIEGATALFDGLKGVDETTVILAANEILEEQDINPRELDPVRALRLGIRAGMRIGRQEGANVVSQILEGTEGE